MTATNIIIKLTYKDKQKICQICQPHSLQSFKNLASKKLNLENINFQCIAQFKNESNFPLISDKDLSKAIAHSRLTKKSIKVLTILIKENSQQPQTQTSSPNKIPELLIRKKTSEYSNCKSSKTYLKKLYNSIQSRNRLVFDTTNGVNKEFHASSSRRKFCFRDNKANYFLETITSDKVLQCIIDHKENLAVKMHVNLIDLKQKLKTKSTMFIYTNNTIELWKTEGDKQTSLVAYGSIRSERIYNQCFLLLNLTLEENPQRSFTLKSEPLFRRRNDNLDKDNQDFFVNRKGNAIIGVLLKNQMKDSRDTDALFFGKIKHLVGGGFSFPAMRGNGDKKKTEIAKGVIIHPSIFTSGILTGIIKGDNIKLKFTGELNEDISGEQKLSMCHKDDTKHLRKKMSDYMVENDFGSMKLSQKELKVEKNPELEMPIKEECVIGHQQWKKMIAQHKHRERRKAIKNNDELIKYLASDIEKEYQENLQLKKENLLLRKSSSSTSAQPSDQIFHLRKVSSSSQPKISKDQIQNELSNTKEPTIQLNTGKTDDSVLEQLEDLDQEVNKLIHGIRKIKIMNNMEIQSSHMPNSNSALSTTNILYKNCAGNSRDLTNQIGLLESLETATEPTQHISEQELSANSSCCKAQKTTTTKTLEDSKSSVSMNLNKRRQNCLQQRISCLNLEDSQKKVMELKKNFPEIPQNKLEKIVRVESDKTLSQLHKIVRKQLYSEGCFASTQDNSMMQCELMQRKSISQSSLMSSTISQVVPKLVLQKF